MNYDLIVIGGGPAGSAAAITASRGGARVLLLERGRFPRHKVCGEFVSSESLQILHTLLAGNDSVLESCISISEARIFLDDQVITAPIHPPAASLTRFDLDYALWTAAEAAGVCTRSQTAVRSVQGDGPFVVTTAEGQIQGRAVVNASGRWSNLNTHMAGAPNKWIGLKAHFFENTPATTVDLYFFPGGYCGVQPVRSPEIVGETVVNVCAMVNSQDSNTLPQVLAQHAGLRERSRGWRPATDMVATSPLRFLKPVPVRDGILQTGDAAGFVDPFVGDGIALALRGGKLAASCLLDFLSGKKTLSDAADDYRNAYTRQLLPVFESSSRLRRLLKLPTALRSPLVRLMHNDAVAGYVVRKTRGSAPEARS